MSNRPFIKPTPVITNASMSANITSLVTLLPQLTRGSFQVRWASGSTPIGTITLQGSDDYSLDSSGVVSNAGTWTGMDVSVSGVTVTTVPVTGNSGSIIIEFQTGVNALRIFYTRSSGTATMNAIITAKVG